MICRMRTRKHFLSRMLRFLCLFMVLFASDMKSVSLATNEHKVDSDEPAHQHNIVTKRINATHTVYVNYSISIDYSYLPINEALLQASTPKLCNLENLLCNDAQLYSSRGMRNVSYHLATRTNLVEIYKSRGFTFFAFHTLFDWIIYPNKCMGFYFSICLFIHSFNLVFHSDKTNTNTSKGMNQNNQATKDTSIPSFETSKQMSLFGRTNKPRTIFVFPYAINYFAQHILPNLTESFVLYSGSNDLTLPYNTDINFVPLYCINKYNGDRFDVDKTNNNSVFFSVKSYPNSTYDYVLNRMDNTNVVDNRYKSSWDTILKSPLLLHWFVENRVLSHEKVSTMPIGMNPHENHPDDKSDHPQHVDALHKRPLKVLLIDRRRPSGVFKYRAVVYDFCIKAGASCVTVPYAVTHKEFIRHLATYPFVLCVHGGGIDPSPKAWEALLVGTIPIIEHSPLDDAYSLFPVVFVDSIADFLQWKNKTEVMKQWVKELGPHYEEGSKLREKVLEKLTTKYWWNKVTSYLK